MKQLATLLLGILLLLLLASCRQSANVETPPEIVYGQDVCDRCGMIINEENFAAAYWTEEGEARRFDDIGGMVAYVTEKSENVATHWVHDFGTGEWIRAEEATYVLDSELLTPMGFGITAFNDNEQARALANGDENVKIVSFMELLDMNITMPDDLHVSSHADAEHAH
jgi:copper chaperone NosL